MLGCNRESKYVHVGNLWGMIFAEEKKGQKNKSKRSEFKEGEIKANRQERERHQLWKGSPSKCVIHQYFLKESSDNGLQ